MEKGVILTLKKMSCYKKKLQRIRIPLIIKDYFQLGCFDSILFNHIYLHSTHDTSVFKTSQTKHLIRGNELGSMPFLLCADFA